MIFLGLTILRTRSTKISAPPPGSEARPAERKSCRVSLIDLLAILENEVFLLEKKNGLQYQERLF